MQGTQYHHGKRDEVTLLRDGSTPLISSHGTIILRGKNTEVSSSDERVET